MTRRKRKPPLTALAGSLASPLAPVPESLPTTKGVKMDDFDVESANAQALLEMEDPRLADLQALFSANTLPFPRYMPMQYPTVYRFFYVRACYEEYYDYLMKVFEKKGEVRGMAVTGTPGIGKTYFMAYSFLRFRLENPKATMILKTVSLDSRLEMVMV